jgi:hypothetical protein
MFEPGNQLARKPEDQLSQTQDAINGRKRHAAVKAKAEAERRQDEAERRHAEDAKADREFEKQHPREYTPTAPEELEKIQAGSVINRNPERIPTRHRDYEFRDDKDYEVMAIEFPNVIVYTDYGRELKSRGVLEACAFTKTFPLDSVHLASPEAQKLEPVAVPNHATAPPEPPEPRPTLPIAIHDALVQNLALADNRSGSTTK